MGPQAKRGSRPSTRGPGYPCQAQADTFVSQGGLPRKRWLPQVTLGSQWMHGGQQLHGGLRDGLWGRQASVTWASQSWSGMLGACWVPTGTARRVSTENCHSHRLWPAHGAIRQSGDYRRDARLAVRGAPGQPEQDKSCSSPSCCLLRSCVYPWPEVSDRMESTSCPLFWPPCFTPRPRPCPAGQVHGTETRPKTLLLRLNPVSQRTEVAGATQKGAGVRGTP